MPKVFVYIRIIISIITISIFLIIYFLYPNNNNGLQATKNIQNISQKEEINNKKEIEKEKSSNKIIIYSIIGVLILIVIIGVIIFLLFKYRKNKKNSKNLDLIISAEKAVKNFIKVKSRNLFKYGIYFLIDTNNATEEMLQKNSYIKLNSMTNTNLLKITKPDDIKEIINLNKDANDEELKDRLLFIFDSYSKGKKIKKFFKDKKREYLIDLLFIIRLGVFGNLKAIEKDFDLLKSEDLDAIEKQASFLKLDSEAENEICIDIFDDITNRNNLKENDISEIEERYKKISRGLCNLIGDQESGYRVNETYYRNLGIHDFLNSEKNKNCVPIIKYNKEKKRYMDKNFLTIYLLFQKIRSILLHIKGHKNLNKEENITWRIMIKEMVEAFRLWIEFLDTVEETKKNNFG